MFLLFAFLSWLLLSSLRDYTVGADTLQYFHVFNIYSSLSYEEIFNAIILYIAGVEEVKDPGYWLFVKLISSFVDDYRFFLIVVAFIFHGTLVIWLLKFSPNPCIGILIYSALFYSFFAITGIRQTLATAFVVFIGYFLIENKRFFYFVALSLFAFLLHKSALVFFPFYIISRLKVTRLRCLVAILVFFVVFAFRVPAAIFLQSISGYEYGVYDGAGTRNFTLMLFAIVLVITWRINKIKDSFVARSSINAILLAFLFLPLTWVNPSAMRVVQYFSLFLMVAFPIIVNTFSHHERPFVYFSSSALLLLFLVNNNPYYSFYFNWL